MSSETKTHYFLAIPFDQETKDWILVEQMKVQQRKNVTYQDWLKYDDFHLTLVFLGALEQSDVEALINHVKLQKQAESFHLLIGNIGFFGLINRPRVAWLAVERTNALLDLNRKYRAATEQLQIKTDNREYCPHITLAKKWKGPASATVAEECVSARKTINVTRVALYRIYIGTNKKYREVHSWQLE